MNTKIGALWIRQSKNGQEYLSGTIQLPNQEPFRIVAFANTNKQSDRHPDYEILLSRPRDGVEQAQQIERANDIQIDLPEEEEEIKMEDIPF